jgi:predicted lipoprotein
VSVAADSGRRAPARRRISPRLIGLGLTVLVVAAILLSTTYKKGDVKTTASGQKAFDPASYGTKTFPKAVAALEKNAVPLPKLLDELRTDQAGASEQYGRREGTSPYAFATKGEGIAGKARAGLMEVKVRGVPESTRVSLQIGPALNGTSIRDAVGFVKFGQFTNQVEYADAATAFNQQVKARVLKNAKAADLAGKKVSFLGAFTLITPNVVTITPVRLEASA